MGDELFRKTMIWTCQCEGLNFISSSHVMTNNNSFPSVKWKVTQPKPPLCLSFLFSSFFYSKFSSYCFSLSLPPYNNKTISLLAKKDGWYACSFLSSQETQHLKQQLTQKHTSILDHNNKAKKRNHFTTKMTFLLQLI